jgi:GntR family transcriptional regulator
VVKPPEYRVDKKLPTPAYLQLKQQLQQAIVAGALRPGQALPSERELSEQLGLSRMTIRHAFESLAAEELVEQRQGSGTYVRSRALEQTIDRLVGYTDEIQHLGREPGSRQLGVERRPAGLVAGRALGTPSSTEVLVIRRLRLVDQQPVAIQVAHLAPQLTGLSLETLGQLGSLYATLKQQFGVAPFRARQTISARLPTRQEMELLEITHENPVLALERTSFASDGQPFEYVQSAYRGDSYRLALDLRAP